DKTEEALEALEEAIELDPNYGEAWELRGNILEDLEKYESSMRAYERALLGYQSHYNMHDDIKYLHKKGSLLEKLSRFEECYEVYDYVVKRDEKNLLAMIKKIEMLIEMERYKEAVIEANKYLERYEDVDLYILRGNGFEGLDNPQKALDSYCKAVELDDKKARLALGRFLGDQGEIDEALDVLEQETWDEKLLIANLCLEMGDFEKAKLIFDELVTEKERDIRSIYGLGVALYELGEYKRASKLMDRCLGIDEDFEPAWLLKSKVYSKMGKFKKALEYSKIAISIAGKYEEAEKLIEEIEERI
ncbi:MAG: tetratricopeptide repeat protein, partial [Candidatus Saliniplasma sp.]